MKSVLFIHNQQQVLGGIERFVMMQVGILQNIGYVVDILVDTISISDDNSDFLAPFRNVYCLSDMKKNEIENLIAKKEVSALFIHKIVSEHLIDQMTSTSKSVLFVHDHDYYCPRHHKYYPIVRKNCHHSYSVLRCGACTMMIEKSSKGIRPFNILKFGAILQKLKKIEHSVVLSHYMKNNLVLNEFSPDTISIIPPPVLLPDEISPQEDEHPVKILYLGQLIRGKGVDLLLQALQEVDSSLYHLNIVGDGNDMTFLKDMVEELGLSQTVTFHGWQKDAVRFFKEASFSVVPSRWQEPYGLSGVEALSYGVPVVGFDVGGVSDWLPDSEWGVLVLPNNTMALKDAITFLINNPKSRKIMGEKGRVFVKTELSYARYVENIEGLLERLNG